MEPKKEELPRITATKSGDLAVAALIPAERCAKCRAVMVGREYLGPYNNMHDRPNEFTRSLIAIGVAVKSTGLWESGLCRACEKAGSEVFICALCKQERSSDQVEESYGDPPDRLCVQCFETVPAKAWKDAMAALYESHRHDYS